MLVEFLIENNSEIFGEDILWPVSTLAVESPEHIDSSTGKRMEEGLSQTGAAAFRFDMGIHLWKQMLKEPVVLHFYRNIFQIASFCSSMASKN